MGGGVPRQWRPCQVTHHVVATGVVVGQVVVVVLVDGGDSVEYGERRVADLRLPLQAVSQLASHPG